MCGGREFHNVGANDKNENLYISVCAAKLFC